MVKGCLKQDSDRVEVIEKNEQTDFVVNAELSLLYVHTMICYLIPDDVLSLWYAYKSF